MSISIPSNATPGDVFQTQFGIPPGSQDPKAECQKWAQLCGTLLAERERLRTELEKANLARIIAEWNQEPIGSMEEVYATVDRETTFEQLIQEIERDAEGQE